MLEPAPGSGPGTGGGSSGAPVGAREQLAPARKERLSTSVTVLVSGSRDLTLTARRIEHLERAVQLVVRAQGLSDPAAEDRGQLAHPGSHTMPVEDVDTTGTDVTLLHGDCRGIDRSAASWAASRGWGVRAFPARRHVHGRGAGPVRNQEMVDASPDVLIAFPGAPKGRGSRGTWDCVKRVYSAGVPVLVPYGERLFVYSSDKEDLEGPTVAARALRLTPGTRTVT